MTARVLVLLVWLVAGCGPVFDRGPLPRLVATDWVDGETAVYGVSRNDSLLYTTTVVLTLDEEAELVPGSGRPIPTLVMTSITEPADAAEFFFDSVTVVLRRDSLLPLRSVRVIETTVAEFRVTASYRSGAVAIRKETIDGATEDVLNLPARTFANDAVPVLLRAVPLEPSTTFRINLAVPLEFRTIPARVQVLGTRLIATKLGDILCREIALTTPGRTLRYWYELAAPHRFVGLVDRSSDLQVVLEEWAVPVLDSVAD